MHIIYTSANGIFDGPVTNPFTCSCEVGKKSLTGFKFGTTIGRFPSDRGASMAVKGLMLTAHETDTSLHLFISMPIRSHVV